MSQWAGGVLTAAGRVLQAKVESGTTLTLTKIKLGDGTESMGAVDNLTDLVSPKAELGISSATSDGDVATITGVMSATLLQAGFYCREWGLFAQDPDAGEILYMITIDSQPEWLPASTEAAQVSATYAMNIAVANATNIEVNIDPAGLVDVDMLNEILGVAERSKAYSVGNLASMPGLTAEHYLRCITAGTTGANTPVLPANIKDGDKITDGTVMWQVTKAMSAAELGYRQPSTTYTAGQIAYHATLPTGWYLECTTAGDTDAGALVITSPSVGDTVTDGTVVWTIGKSLSVNGDTLYGTTIGRSVTDSIIRIVSGPTPGNGASLILIGKDNTSFGDTKGSFSLNATTDSDTVCTLTGYASGKLLWDHNDLAGSAIVAKSLGTNGYVKYASGLIVQWGTASFSGTSTSKSVSFNVAFTNGAPAVNVTPVTNISGTVYTVSSRNTTGFTVVRNNTTAETVTWLAIGY